MTMIIDHNENYNNNCENDVNNNDASNNKKGDYHDSRNSEKMTVIIERRKIDFFFCELL